MYKVYVPKFDDLQELIVAILKNYLFKSKYTDFGLRVVAE